MNEVNEVQPHWMRPPSASLRHRIRRRNILRFTVPVVSPYLDRLARAAMDDHSCRPCCWGEAWCGCRKPHPAPQLLDAAPVPGVPS